MPSTVPFKFAVEMRRGAAVLFGDERDGRRDRSDGRLRYGTIDADETGTVPVVDAKGVVGRHSEANAQGPAILLAPSFGGFRVEWIEEPSCILETCSYVDATCTDYDLRYVFHFLRLAGVLSETPRPGFVPGTLEGIGALRMPACDRDRQIAVAARIDAADETHGRLATALERMASLLAEKRKASTADAFGLDAETVAEIGVVPGI